MATKKSAANRYTVSARIRVNVGLEVQATNMEEALEKSKALKLGDFIDILGDHNDSEGPVVVSISADEWL